MNNFKIKQFDMNNNLLRSDIVKGKDKDEVKQWFMKQTETIEGEVLPAGIMANDIFYINIVEMEIIK